MREREKEKGGQGGREKQGGSARVGRRRWQRKIQPSGCILDVWAPHTCHVSYITENLIKANGIDHFDV
ncbi:unnamed protein product [Prunus armeniaca]